MRLASFATLALLACSCGPRGGTDVGNGATVVIDFRAYEPPPPPAPAGAQKNITLTSGVRVDAAYIVVDQLELRPECGGSDEEGEIDVEGPLVADLLGGGALGGAPMFPTDPGAYCRLRVDVQEIEPAELPAGAPADLGGHAIYVAGQRADGVPFLVRSNKSFEFRVDAKNASFDVAAGEQPFLLGFDLASWIDALELDTFTEATIVIDDETEPQVVDAFEAAVKTSARLFRDEDRDGELSPSESAAEKELAVGRSD